MSFILGCNYWASNAGTEMWRNFDYKVIENDIRILHENGVMHIRAFPNWSDFQPIMTVRRGMGDFSHFCLDGGKEPQNPYFLEETMMTRFSDFLEICEKYDIKVIVGIITGWMSGGLFVPGALCDRNVITDEVAQYFEQLFIKGFVERFKDRDVIYAWDLGNECNCMGRVNNRWQAANWTSIISNAIRAVDTSRPIVSGMHSLEIQTNWTIQDQAMFTDMLTTHPYPFWNKHTRIDNTLSLRTTLHPTAQTKFYSEIGNKPCLAEEIGTMGPMLCSDENAAKFLRINMFSLWANGASGVMWWCANEQTNLLTFPYTHQMVEQELGMIDANHNPKPVLIEMKKFSDFLRKCKLELPPARTDAICVLTRDQQHWGVGYMTYILTRLVGLNCNFAYGDQEIPSANLYLLPSINGMTVLPKCKYEELKKRVFDGADLYISIEGAVLSEFENLVGVKVIDSYEYTQSNTAKIDEESIGFSRIRNMLIESSGAEVIAYDNEGNPFITVNHYGKGKVFFVNAPIESSLLQKHNAFDGNIDVIYRKIFSKHINNLPIKLSDKEIIMTYHSTTDGAIIVALNHSELCKKFEVCLDSGYSIQETYYGCIGEIDPFDACVFRIVKEET